MAKIAYNACFGGFSLSEEAVRLGRKLSGDPRWADSTLPGEYFSDGSGPCKHFYGGCRDIDRADPILIQVIETLGERANGECAMLAIAELPEGTQYRIDEYDGNERVMTRDSYDWATA